MNYERFKKTIVSLSLMCVIALSTMVASVVPANAQGYYYYYYYPYQVQQPYYPTYYRPVYNYPYSGYRYRVVNPYRQVYGYPYGYYPYRQVYSPYGYGYYPTRQYYRHHWYNRPFPSCWEVLQPVVLRSGKRNEKQTIGSGSFGLPSRNSTCGRYSTGSGSDRAPCRVGVR